MVKVSDSELKQLYTEFNGSAYAIAKELGVNHASLARRVRKLGLRDTALSGAALRDMTPKTGDRTLDKRLWQAVSKGPEEDDQDFEVQAPLPVHQSVDDLLAERSRKFLLKRKHEESRKLIPVKVNIPGPIGILHFGDPHIDDDGTDIVALQQHVKLVKSTEGLFAANVGDTTNNWVGRLARLYGDQSTSAEEAWILAEWFVKELRRKWLYILGGNHDLWSGAGDPLKWICNQIDALNQPSEARLALQFQNGREVVINARHDFSGHSQWNPAHGVGKAAQLGAHDHILICGHKHTSGYMQLKCPATGTISHAIQVASYKVYDRFARDKGFRDQNISPCVVTIINPEARNETGLVQVFTDPSLAAQFLTAMRKGWIH